MAVVSAVCLSEEKGTRKENRHRGVLVADHGLAGDAHAGRGHRQVSLLSRDKVEEFKASGAAVRDGDFGENLLVSGMDLKTLPIGAKLQVGSALLEVTQIGKECHSRCQIYYAMGDCIMPREGIFARVLEGGEVAEGDAVLVL